MNKRQIYYHLLTILVLFLGVVVAIVKIAVIEVLKVVVIIALVVVIFLVVIFDAAVFVFTATVNDLLHLDTNTFAMLIIIPDYC